MEHSNVFTMTESFQRGEEKGFKFFFNSLYPALLYYGYRILDNQQEAEDIVEESMIKIWERHCSFSHPQVIKSWLYTTVRNACINKLQADKRQKSHREIIAAEQQHKYQESHLAGIVISETITEVHRAIKVLPPMCRKIFELIYIKNMSVREAAQELKIKISTVKNQKYRGLEILRKKCNLAAA